MGKDPLLREVVFALEFWTDVSRTGWLFLRMERRLLQPQSLRAVWAAGEAHGKLGDAVEKGLLSSPPGLGVGSCNEAGCEDGDQADNCKLALTEIRPGACRGWEKQE